MPEITEPIDVINKRLADVYGSEIYQALPIYRIVFAGDQLEKRYGTWEDYGPHDIFIRRVTEVREVPKYPVVQRDKYVLENLVLVPEFQQKELGAKISYEPMFFFMDKSGFPLPPKWEVCEWVISHVRAVKGDNQLKAKYVDPLISEPREEIERRVAEMKDALFGNETDVTDALAYKEGIVVPNNYKGSN